MKHERRDYDRIQDPAVDDPSLLGEGCSPIGEDEPVFLLRARDRLAPHNLMDYAARADETGLFEVARSAREHAQRMRDWQMIHGCKNPDLPGEAKQPGVPPRR